MFYFLSVLFIIKYRVYPSEQIKLFIYNELQSEVCWANSLCIKWCILINVHIERCFFHLSVYANIWILKLGLMNKYRSDADFKMRMKKLATLAFIPLVCQFTKN